MNFMIANLIQVLVLKHYGIIFFDVHTVCVVSSREEQDQLTNKLAALEKKIIVGGENLLEKAEEQERMLEESAKELEARKVKEEALRKALLEKEVGMVQIQHAVRYMYIVH